MALLKDLTVFGATNLIDDTFVNNIYGNGFHHNAHNTDTYFLLAGGGAKELSAISSDHNHNSSTPRTAWGQTYVDASGNLLSINGNISSVGNITPTTTETSTLGSMSLLWKWTHTNRINLNRVGSANYGRIYYYNSSYCTWVNYMTNNGSTNAATGGVASTTTEVTTWALRSLIEKTAGYGWIWESCANSANANPAARMSLSSNTGRLRIAANASTTSKNTGGLIVSSAENGSSGNISIELWRGTNASWSISNESGTLHIRDNYDTAARDTFLHDNLQIAYNTGTISTKSILPFTTNTYNLGSAGSSGLRWAKLYIGGSDSYGSATQGIYWNAGVPTACTVSINSGTTNKLTYYSSNTAISAYTSDKGSLTKGIYLAAGVPTEMTYSLNATVNSSGNNNAGTVAYYSGTNTISSATKLFYDGSLWVGETTDAQERDLGVRSVAGTLYIFAQNSSTGYRGLYTVNSGNSGTSVILIDKDNNITFNGYLNGTASNADTVDGYHAYTSNEWNALKTLGNDGVIELGRYIDMHFIANDVNDYSTRIQLTSNPNPANVLSLPTETGTLVTDVHPYGYVMKEYWVDYSTSNVDTYYPVIFDLSNHKKDNVRIEVIVALDSETKPAWSSHNTQGFSCCAIWEVNGSGWGTSVIRRTIYAWDWGWCDGTKGQCPMANIGQLSNSSEEYILLRGGGKYRIRTSHGVIPVAKYASYTGWDEQSIEPISYNTSSNSWPDKLNVSGYSTDPNIIDMGTTDNFGTTYGIFKYIGSSSTTLTVEIGGVRRTCTINPGIYVYNNYSSVTTIYPIGINSSGDGRWTTFFKRSEFYFTSEGAYHTSDIRKKYDIYDILNNDVNQLFETENGFIRHFKWKETSSDAYGFIAQELQEYCPEAVDLNEDNGYYSVNYNVAFSKIIGAMFKKIKELERKLQEKENH